MAGGRSIAASAHYRYRRRSTQRCAVGARGERLVSGVEGVCGGSRGKGLDEPRSASELSVLPELQLMSVPNSSAKQLRAHHAGSNFEQLEGLALVLGRRGDRRGFLMLVAVS